MTPEEILARAADLVDNGWCQGVYQDDDGNVCMRKALLIASGLSEDNFIPENIYQAAWKEIGYGERMTDWNDASGRTKEEVSTALRNAKRWL